MKQQIFGILCRNGTVWAEVVDDIEANYTLTSYLTKNINGFRRMLGCLESLYRGCST
jgi:hypothetical protein